MTLLAAVLAGLAVAVLLVRPRGHRLEAALGPAGGARPPGRDRSAGGAAGGGPRPPIGGGGGSRRTPNRRRWPSRSRREPSRSRRAPSRSRRAPGRPRAGSTAGPPERAAPSRLPPPQVVCGLTGAAAAVVLPLPAGVAVGLALALLGPRLLARLEPAAARREREQLLDDLPLLLDLLAACLAGGAPLASAAPAVAAALPGPAGRRAAAVAAALEVGCPPAEAWQALAAGDADDPLAPAARALARAADGGAPVAATVARLAAEARLDARARGEQAARRVGVVAVAPLGLCFLPAFVLLGIVPVVVGLAAPLLASS